jgi:hypothetical protein
LDKAKLEGEGATTSVVEKLNKTMFIKLQEIEAKREKATALERRLSKMAGQLCYILFSGLDFNNLSFKL